MKKIIRKSIYITAFLLTFLLCSLMSASAVDTEYCTAESVKVASYSQLKEALQNFTDGQSIILTNNIEITDDKNDLTINICKQGVVALELNGKKISVNSKATKYLFNITGNAKLYFVNSNESDSGNISFNSSKSDNALIYIDNDFARINNINVKLTVGDVSTYSASGTSVFCVNKASELNLYGGVIVNRMSGGDGVKVIESTAANRLNLRIGGDTEIQANRHAVIFNTDKINSVIFGSSVFRSSSNAERIKVQSGCSLTVKDLWYSSNSAYATSVKNGGILNVSSNLKITSLSKADITATKRCDYGTPNEETILYYSGGHVTVCAICYMAYLDIDSHNNVYGYGTSAGCTTPGKSSGYVCEECRYSTQTTIPPKGHNPVYKEKVPDSCGVNGMKAHYYCSGCNSYFEDKDCKNKVDRSSLIIENRHKTEIIPAVAPSCTEKGNTSGLRCLTCPRIIQHPTEIPKTQHNYPVNWTVLMDSTCQHEGIREKACIACGNKVTETIPRFSHSYDKDGNCITCGKNESDPEPEPENPGSSGSGTVNCSCNCHKKGILNFFFKIILFFQRIFRANQFCKGCGAAHY